MNWSRSLDWYIPVVLFATSGFAFWQANYTSAVICAACAGFCLGLACARYFVRRW